MALSLFPYQLDGVTFLSARRHALLADDMGLGKTPQAVVASEVTKSRRILVICPGMLCRMWVTEIHRWRRTRIPVQYIDTSSRPVPADGAVVLSYDMAIQPAVLAQLLSFRWDLLICDEAHFLKEHEAQRTRSVLGISCTGHEAIAGHCERVWFLTGTPICNHPGELFPIMKFCGAWSSGYGRFLSTFCFYSNHPRYGVRVKPECRDANALKSLLRPIMLRRLKSEVAQHLPALTVSELLLEPRECDPEQQFLEQLREEYPAAAAKLQLAYDSGDWGFSDDPAVARVRRLIGLAKVAGLVELLRYELEHGLRKVVVFGIHRDFLRYMAAGLRRWKPGILYGGTSDRYRQRVLTCFQDEGFDVLLAQQKVAGTGLTITAADNVVIGEPSWTPADNAQAIMRVHRIGQHRPVTARFATLVGTIDEAVNAILQRKSSEIAAILS